MSSAGGAGWLDEERHELAREQLLDAAAERFADRGVAAVGMAEVARAAGCSRATLYRYYANRDELRAAFVDREARRIGAEIAAAVARVADPRQQLVEAVLAALTAVRGDETLTSWFTADNAGTAVGVAQASAVISGLASGFLGDPDSLDPDVRARSDWLIRCIVSLLAVPAAMPDDERTLVERFVAPVVVPEPAKASSRRR
jgi:AcrR family transcriptional regulator